MTTDIFNYRNGVVVLSQPPQASLRRFFMCNIILALTRTFWKPPLPTPLNMQHIRVFRVALILLAYTAVLFQYLVNKTLKNDALVHSRAVNRNLHGHVVVHQVGGAVVSHEY